MTSSQARKATCATCEVKVTAPPDDLDFDLDPRLKNTQARLHFANKHLIPTMYTVYVAHPQNVCEIRSSCKQKKSTTDLDPRLKSIHQKSQRPRVSDRLHILSKLSSTDPSKLKFRADQFVLRRKLGIEGCSEMPIQQNGAFSLSLSMFRPRKKKSCSQPEAFLYGEFCEAD